MPIAVSACLLGEPCRYDGKSRPCEDVLKLHDACEMVPVCPEVLGGLPVPQPSIGKIIKHDEPILLS